MLELDIKTRFGDFPLKVALDIPNGVTALVGPSGAGKSSLMRLIAGLERPDAGRISLNEVSFVDVGRQQFLKPERRQIGMVFQRPALLPHIDVLKNIQIGSRGAAVTTELLQQTGCQALLDKPVAALSGGEQQRVMLARALAGKPKLLLLDEPMSALDAKAKSELLSLFAELIPALDIPVIYVSHAMEEAGRVAQKFALMQLGRIVASGSATEVLSAYGDEASNAISSLLQGSVTALEADGLACVKVGDQQVELASRGLDVGDRVALRLWARDIILARRAPKDISARNALSGMVSELSPLPNGSVAVHVSLKEQSVIAIVMARTVSEMGLEVGQKIMVLFKSAAVERA